LASKAGKWLTLGAGFSLLLVLFGGYLVDAVAINLSNNRTMRGIGPEPGSRLTNWGACRQAHVTGRSLLLQGEFNQSLSFLEEAAVCNNDPWVWFDLGQAQYALGDLEGAAESWQQTPEGYNRAVRLAQATAEEDEAAQWAAWQFASQVNPTEHAPYIQMARLVVESDPAQFVGLLQQAVETNPNDPAAFIELGYYFQERRDLAAAQMYFEQAIALDSTNIPLLVTLAENAAVLGDTPAAIDYWQEVALRNERRRAMAYYRIGALTFNDNNFSSALAFFRRAFEINPENSQFLLGLANTYFELGCQDEAADAYQEILSFAESAEVLAEAELKLAELAAMTTESVTCPDGS
jgi:tetratricopeptide (TPR) repeat protein